MVQYYMRTHVALPGRETRGQGVVLAWEMLIQATQIPPNSFAPTS